MLNSDSVRQIIGQQAFSSCRKLFFLRTSPRPTEQSATIVRPKIRRLALWRALSLLFGLGLSAVLAELALRLFGIGYPALYYPDFYCGSRLLPSTTGVWIEEGNARVSINSLGFRGPEFEAEKPKGTIRVALLGDSFIEALQVDHEKSFTGQFQKCLSEFAQGGNRRIEVINCGVSGFGTAQELLLLRHYVFPLNPDAVLVSVFPENDLWNNSHRLSGEDSRPYFSFRENQRLILDESFRLSPEWLAASTRLERLKRSVVNSSRLLQVLKRAKRVLLNTQQVDTTQQVQQ